MTVPNYTVSERYYSKSRRSNDNAGSVSFRSRSFIKIVPFTEISRISPSFFWNSRGVDFVNIYLKRNTGDFVMIADNVRNDGFWTFTEMTKIASAFVRVESATDPELVDTSSAFFYYFAPTRFFLGDLITPAVVVNNNRFFLGDYLPVTAPTITHNIVNNTIEMT